MSSLMSTREPTAASAASAAPTAPAAPTPTPTAAARAPSRARLAGFVFLFVYPLVTLVLYGLMPLTRGLEIWQRNLVMVPIMVVCMVYVIIPMIHRRLGHLL